VAAGGAEATRGAVGDSGVAPQVSVWLRLAQWGMTGPHEAQQASSRPHEAEIPEGLTVWTEEPEGVRSPGEPPGRAGRPPWW
jgi:hypothetical protein